MFMKKILFMILAVTVLAACSTDNDTSESGDDMILGKWFLADAKAGSVSLATECQKNSNITFGINNFAESEYYESNDANECNLESSDQGTWSKSANSQYTFDVPGYEKLTGTVSFEGTTSFTFTSPEIAPLVFVFEK